MTATAREDCQYQPAFQAPDGERVKGWDEKEVEGQRRANAALIPGPCPQR